MTDPKIVTLVADVTADTTALCRRLNVMANGFEDAAEALRRTVRNLATLGNLDREGREQFGAETVTQAEKDLARYREARRRAERGDGGR